MKSIKIQPGNETEVKELARFLFAHLSDSDLRLFLTNLLDEVANYQRIVTILEEYEPEPTETGEG